jgi:TonB family protein
MNRKSVFRASILVAFLVVFTAFGTTAQGVKITKIGDAPQVEEDTTVYKFVDAMPEFSGGDKALQKFLVDNIVYPESARESNIEGRVLVGFIVEKDGRLSNFTILESVHSILDNEVLRVIKLMPNWIPGTLQGRMIVRTQFQQPVLFQLHDDRKETVQKKVKKRY